MRKKIFAMYALAGALVASPVFTSCVDDTESASVTAIRNAKAEQLKAMAELDKAQAAYQLAQAALKNAEAEYKANETAEAKAKFTYQIESIKAQYEASIMQYKYNKAQYENWLKTQEETAISDAASRYTTALDNVNELNEDLFIAKANLAQVGIDSAMNVALFNEYVAEKNAIIAEATVAIEKIKAYEGETEAALEEKKVAVVEKYKALKNEKVYADDAKTKADDAVLAAGDAYDDVAYVDVVADLINDYNMTINSEDFDATTGLGAYVESYSALLESELLQTRQDLKDDLAAAKTTLGTAKTDAAAATGLYVTLETLEAAVKTAEDALAANTDATLTASLEADVTTAKVALAQFKEGAWKTAQDDITEAEDAIAEFEALVAAFAEGSDEQKEWAAAQEALVAAKKAAEEADDKVKDLQDAIDATGISSIAGNGNVIASTEGEYVILNSLIAEDCSEELIAELEADIAEAKAAIETGLAANYLEKRTETEYWWDANGDRHQITREVYVVIEVASTDIVKAIYEAEIAAIEAELAIQEALLAKYEAELQALLAE